MHYRGAVCGGGSDGGGAIVLYEAAKSKVFLDDDICDDEG
jgi:hypothetical protein